MNRHKQQSEKAKEMIEKLRSENGKSLDIDEVSRKKQPKFKKSMKPKITKILLILLRFSVFVESFLTFSVTQRIFFTDKCEQFDSMLAISSKTPARLTASPLKQGL